MRHEVREFVDADEAAGAAADFVADVARRRLARAGAFTLAVSGGSTPQKMFAALDGLDVPWEQTVFYQVDERVAPRGDPQRNLTGLRHGLSTSYPVIEAMPVNDPDLDAAAARYAATLPARFDLVHLGLGADGHTASLVPGDPVLEVTDELVALTGEYQGHRRMTMTYRALARADQLLWLVTGQGKRDALARLLEGDTAIPAGRVEAPRSVIIADRSAL